MFLLLCRLELKLVWGFPNSNLQMQTETVVDCSADWLRTVHPTVEIEIRNREGMSVKPSRCTAIGQSAVPCDFVRLGTRNPRKPLLTPTGPVFTQCPRFRCKVHNGWFEFKDSHSRLLLEGQRFHPPQIRFGEVRAN